MVSGLTPSFVDMSEPYNSAAGLRDDHWGERCVAEVRGDHSLVTGAVSGLITQLLKEALSERALTSGEIAVLAKQLLNDMIPAAASPISAEGEPPR
jgi:hypothetical protein